MTLTVYGWDVMLALSVLCVVLGCDLWRRGQGTRAMYGGIVTLLAVLWLGYLLGRWMPCA